MSFEGVVGGGLVKFGIDLQNSTSQKTALELIDKDVAPWNLFLVFLGLMLRLCGVHVPSSFCTIPERTCSLWDYASGWRTYDYSRYQFVVYGCTQLGEWLTKFVFGKN